jgi:hypothetical protein
MHDDAATQNRSAGAASMPAPAARAAVVAIDMGYGHLRPARTLAAQLGSDVLHADREPLADQEERRTWAGIRNFYERVSRVSGLAVVGPPFRTLLDTVTHIPPLYPFRDLSSPTLGVMALERAARKGLGRTMVSYLAERDLQLLTTFYSPALLADFHGYDRILCLVTDSDVNRVWAPIAPSSSKIRYLAPSGRVVRRLRAYGVDKNQIDLTGFPLPHSLVGGPDAPVLRRNLAARIARLDPGRVFQKQYEADIAQLGELPATSGPPHLVFAVGGAGAQAELPRLFLPSLRPHLVAGRLRLTLVAGSRRGVLEELEQHVEQARLSSERGRSLDILFEPETDRYFERFDALLAQTDILWTKPSEMVFYAGLGIPLLLSEPIGVHESYNRRFARENGAALKQRDPRTVGERIVELLDDGNLAAAAWAGYRRLPHLGLYRILERLQAGAG